MIKNEWRWSETRAKRANYLEAMAAKKENKKLTADQKQAVTVWQQIEKFPKPDTAETNTRADTPLGVG